uniref:Uncharacterized protein n=1 Tax=Myripristis murdjan TaxID=586833 RepID=A0A667ZYP1_9TELE
YKLATLTSSIHMICYGPVFLVLAFFPPPQSQLNKCLSFLSITLQGTSACRLPTCATVNLGSSMQYGDQTAGDATKDPYGNGKK